MAKRFASKKGIPCFSSNIKRAQTKGLAWCQYDSVRGITPLRNKRPATHCLFKPDANSRFFSALPFLLYNGNNYAPLTALPLLPHQQHNFRSLQPQFSTRSRSDPDTSISKLRSNLKNRPIEFEIPSSETTSRLH